MLAGLGLFHIRHAKARACAARNGSATAYIDRLLILRPR